MSLPRPAGPAAELGRSGSPRVPGYSPTDYRGCCRLYKPWTFLVPITHARARVLQSGHPAFCARAFRDRALQPLRPERHDIEWSSSGPGDVAHGHQPIPVLVGSVAAAGTFVHHGRTLSVDLPDGLMRSSFLCRMPMRTARSIMTGSLMVLPMDASSSLLQSTSRSRSRTSCRSQMRFAVIPVPLPISCEV